MSRPVKILLVEDDAGDAWLLRSTLAGSLAGHHEIEHVTTLGEATTRLAQLPMPDIVLLDLSLADSAGQATIDALFQGSRQVPVMVLTGLDDDAVATAAMESGAQDYVVKGSVTGEVLARMIRHAIERHQLQSALGERVKEQAGLLAISQTLNRDLSRSQRCVEIAGHLTDAMQFPSVCHATVTLDTASARAGPESTTDLPVLTSPITVDGAQRGQVVVGYSEPDLDFLIPEEQTLLESAARAIGGWLARQDTSRRLARDEERLRILVSQLPGIVWTTDRDLRVTSATGGALSALDVDPEELEGQPLPDLLGDDRSEEILAMFETALAGGPVEFERSWQGRSWRHRIEPNRADLDGRIVGTVCLAMDVTTERQQQSEIEVAHQRFRGLFTETQDAMLLADDDGVYVDANPAASTLTGYDRDELLGMTVTDLLPHDHAVTPDVALAMWQQFLDDGVMAGDFPIRRKDGTVVDTEFRAVANIAPGVHLSTLRDITARKRAEQALRKALQTEQEATERLRAVDEIKSNFLQAVSHELRTPLTSVLGYAHTLTSGRLTPEQTAAFHQRLLHGAKRLDGLLGDLLDVDRLNKGIVRLDLQQTDLAAVAADVAAEIDFEDRTLIIDHAPAVAVVDATQIERIIHNLIANAAKHTPAGSTIWVSFPTTDDGITITVSDDGPGIPEVDREHVFEPFWQALAVGSMASPGTGIGLALVRQFAALHGGSSSVEPRDGGGASFRVELPSQPADRPTGAREVVLQAAGPDAPEVATHSIDRTTGAQGDSALGRVLNQLQGHHVIVVLTLEPGHAAGSDATATRLLDDLATRLSSTSDFTVLTSQHELVLVLPDTPMERATEVADRIHRAWEDMPETLGRISSAVAPATSGAVQALDDVRAAQRVQHDENASANR